MSYATGRMAGPISNLSACLVLSLVACASPNGGADDEPRPDASGDGGGNGDASIDPTTITVKLTERTHSLDRFAAAYQDGTGAWAVAAPPVADTFSFVITSSNWSFTWACEGVSGGVTLAFAYVVSYAVTEKTAVTIPEQCPRAFTAIELSGTVSGTVAGGKYSMGWGERFGVSVVPASGTSFDYELLRAAGSHDLYAGKVEIAGDMTTTTAVAIVRGVSASVDRSNINLDMTNAIATPPELPVTIQGVASEQTYASTTLFDASGTQLDIARTRFRPPHATRGIAAAQMGPGSVYEQLVEAQWCPPSAFAGEYCDRRVVEQWRSTIGAQTVTLPPPLGTVTTTPMGRAVRATWMPYPNAVGYTWVANKGYYPEVAWHGTVGAAYAGTAPSFEIPDLSTLPGWDHFVPEPHGDSVIVGVVRAHVSSLGSSDFPFAYPAAPNADRLQLEARIKIPY